MSEPSDGELIDNPPPGQLARGTDAALLRSAEAYSVLSDGKSHLIGLLADRLAARNAELARLRAEMKAQQETFWKMDKELTEQKKLVEPSERERILLKTIAELKNGVKAKVPK